MSGKRSQQNIIEEQEKIIAEQAQTNIEKDAIAAEKDVIVAEKDEKLKDKDGIIAEQQEKIAELEQLIAGIRKQPKETQSQNIENKKPSNPFVLFTGTRAKVTAKTNVSGATSGFKPLTFGSSNTNR